MQEYEISQNRPSYLQNTLFATLKVSYSNKLKVLL